MTTIKVDVDGGADFGAYLKVKGVQVDEATRRATAEAGRESARLMQARLTRRRHPPGTPTPSPPGEPPAMVSGDLAGSVRPGGVKRSGRGQYEVLVAPHRVYARIQERGGVAGRSHTTVLPARPYLKPRTRAELDAIRRIYKRTWSEAIAA